MADSTKDSGSGNDGNSNSNSNSNSRGRHFGYLSGSMFPNNDGDFASSFMNQGANDPLNRPPSPSDPPPWEDPAQSWCYHKDHVWTGSEWVYAPRRRPRTPAAPLNPLGVPSGAGGVPNGATGGPHGGLNISYLLNPAPAYAGVAQGSSTTYGNAPQGPPTGYSNAFPGPPTYGYTPQDPPPTYGMTPMGPAHAYSSTPPASPAPSPSPAPSSSIDIDRAYWDNEKIFELYKWKSVKKKGMAAILEQFPGLTEAEIAAAWKVLKPEGELLYAEWKDAKTKTKEAKTKGKGKQKKVMEEY